MSDILGLVLDIPAYVDNFTQTCRAIHDYAHLDDSHKAIMLRAIKNSERLGHLTSCVRTPSVYTEATQEYMAGLFLEARSTLERTLFLAEKWRKDLGIKEGETKSRAMRLIPSFSFSGCFGKSNAAAPREEEATGKYMHDRIVEAKYMILGQREITSLMESLEHWLDDLNFAILTTTHLSVSRVEVQNAPSSFVQVAYAIRAKDRIDTETEINFIDSKELHPFSDVDVAMETGIFSVDSGNYEGCIVDPRNVELYTGINKGDIAWRETKNIARLFAEDGSPSNAALCSSVGILPSCGYSEINTHLHAIVFRLPIDSAPPRTLRSLLVEGVTKHSLHDRVQLSIKLSTSVLVVHTLGLVHKSIKPDSILVTERVDGSPKELYPYKIGDPYLLAFDSSRSKSGPTMRGPYDAPAGAIWRTLYKHPRHIGFHRSYDYEMRDDIYSLGICLLEIALWKSLFLWDPESHRFISNTDVLDLSDGRIREELKKRGKPTNTSRSFVRKKYLIDAAKERVAPLMGDLFADVVSECLTFGDAMDADKLMEIGSDLSSTVAPNDQSIRFVKDILVKLHSIKVS